MKHLNTYEKYCKYMQKSYTEYEQITIKNFISYYLNGFKGFGSRNCLKTFSESKRFDNTGRLHSFALIGVQFEKDAIIERERNLKKN